MRPHVYIKGDQMAQSPKELTPYESARHFFGAELRRWREQRELSQSRLGQLVNFDGSLIGKTEKAERMPSLELATACDEVLSTGGALARLWPLVDQERQRAEGTGHAPDRPVPVPGWQPVPGGYDGTRPAAGLGAVSTLEPGTVSAEVCVVPVLTGDGKVVLVALDRRALLITASAAGGALFAEDVAGVEWGRLAKAILAPQRVDAEVVGYLQRVLDEHVVVDMRLGPRQLIAVVIAQMGFVDRLRKGARGGVRNELLAVGARYAEFAGWLYQDTGNTQTATYWTDRALEWAHAALDHVLVSYLLFRKSNQARDERDAEAVIGLAQAAQQVGGPLPRSERAIAVKEEAQGHALAGDEVSCQRNFDEALELVAASHSDGVPAAGRGSSCTEVYIELQRANSWVELGHPQRAIDLYQTQLANLPAVSYRDSGLYQARHAIAHAAARDPEQAAAIGYTALAIARETGSTRIYAELHRLDTTLTPHLDIPAVAQLRHALSAN